MKIYRVSFHDSGLGTLLTWHTNKRAAVRDLREKQREAREAGNEPQGVEDVEPVDVPTDRAGLVSWLNTHFNTDNG